MPLFKSFNCTYVLMPQLFPVRTLAICPYDSSEIFPLLYFKWRAVCRAGRIDFIGSPFIYLFKWVSIFHSISTLLSFLWYLFYRTLFSLYTVECQIYVSIYAFCTLNSASVLTNQMSMRACYKSCHNMAYEEELAIAGNKRLSCKSMYLLVYSQNIAMKRDRVDCCPSRFLFIIKSLKCTGPWPRFQNPERIAYLNMNQQSNAQTLFGDCIMLKFYQTKESTYYTKLAFNDALEHMYAMPYRYIIVVLHPTGLCLQNGHFIMNMAKPSH